MKLKYIILMFTAALLFCRCSDADYTEKYADPSKVSTTSFDKLFTGLLREGSDFITPNYWRFFAFDNQNVGAVCQTYGMHLTSELYEGGYPQYTDEGWWKFQRVLVQFKVAEKFYNECSDADKAKFKAYYLAGKAFMYQCMLQTIDCWGDIPFSESGALPVSGQLVFPKLDDAKTLYTTLLDDLEKISNDLPGAGSIGASTDFLNDGSMDKWVKYVNSILLRAAIRVSSQGDLKDKGENIIKAILSKPLVTGSSDMIKMVNRRNSLFDWSRLEGITDWRQNRLASKAMMDMLDGDHTIADMDKDPRLLLFYDAVRPNDEGTSTNVGKRLGVDTHGEPAAVTALINGSNNNSTCQIAQLNETSFRQNKNIEGYVVTPSEIAFYKAEAIKRGLVPGDAKAEFVRGIKESINLYAQINEKSDMNLDPAVLERSPKIDMSAWTDAAMTAFAESKWKDNLQCIYEQLWLHCGLINSVQSWNTVRRTGFPVLHYPTVDSERCPNVPQRFIVPAAEYSVNPNIQAEKTPDAFYKKLFWAK